MPDIDKLFEKAEKYLQKQKFEAALETYQEIYKYQPNDEEVLLHIGDLCLRFNRNAEGVRYQSQLVDLYAKKNDITRAIATCRKILKVAPHDVNTLSRLGGFLERTNKVPEALEAYREALAQYRAAGAGAQILDCLQRITKLDPNNLNANVELGEQAVKLRQPAVAAAGFLHAAQLARKAGQEDRWAEFVERAHVVDPSDEPASIAAAELFLQKEKAKEAIGLLDPILAAKPDDLTVLELLAKAYLETKDFEKAQPLAWKLYQAKPEAIDLVVKLAENLVQGGKSEPALDLLKQIKPRLFQQGKRDEYLRIVESMYEADESNLPVLETLCGLYNDLNKEDGLRRSLGRLFGLYLAGEQYDSAADTLERIIDVDPYGGGHYDRLLTLEGHIDKIWYDNISSRVQPPSTARMVSSGTGPGEAAAKEGLDDLIIEGEMYHQYQLESKLKETIKKIGRLYPGAEEKNERLRNLYQASGFASMAAVTGAEAGLQAGLAPQSSASTLQQSLEDLKRISEITANIYREGSPQGVMQVAVNEIGRALNASRCWGALGIPDRPPSLTVEYCSPATPSSESTSALEVHGILIHQASTKPDGWLMHDVTKFPVLAPVMSHLQRLRIQSLLALPMMDKDQPVGLLCIQQCDRLRAWSAADALLLQTTATQVVIAVNNTKLRRLAHGLAGTDQATGLVPRSSYLDCLLTEAARAKELSKPLSLCLLEPENPAVLIKSLGDAGLQRYLLQIAKILQSNLRQNDVAIRYSPCAIALVFPDTPLPQGSLALEKIRRAISQVKLDGITAPNLCCAICDVPLGLRFDAVDGVTEVINRLEAAMEQARKERGARLLVSAFEG
jgi:GAF domain-containing protein/thioredoxin-like negative regulator of GroEL